MKDLDPWALELEGTQLIEASAGTGKTYTLTTLYLRILVEHDLLPSEILVVTYTNAATAELRDRVRERIREAIAIGEAHESRKEAEAEPSSEMLRLALRAQTLGREPGRVDPLRRALQEFDEAAIYTIHGFCQRTLQANAFESGVAFDAELIEDSESLQRTLAHDLWSRLLAEEDPEFISWLRFGAGSGWHFEPEALRTEILSTLGADEEMPVLPESSAPSDASVVPLLRSRVCEAWVQWARVWHARRDAVLDLLLGKNDLSRTSYKPKVIEATWLPQLERWASEISAVGNADSMSVVPLPSWWKNLTPSGLEKGLKKNGKAVGDEFFEVCGDLALAIRSLDDARRTRALELRLQFVSAAREAARARRDRQHLLFFDDLLCELRSALRPPEGDRLARLLRDRFRFALIDEFQDTDPVQFEIFRRVWSKAAPAFTESKRENKAGGLFLIGDPKQAIYSFRGADVFTYLSAREDATEGLHSLGVNWRSRPELIAATNTLFEQPERPFGLSGFEFNAVAPRPTAPTSLIIPDRSVAGLRVLLVDRAAAIEAGVSTDPAKKPFPLRFGRTKLMQAMARDVADLLDSGGEIDGRAIQPSDIAILCRRKVELAGARRALEDLGIPCVDRGTSDVFDTREAWELLCVLRAWLRSSDSALLRGAVSTGAHGFDAAAIRALSDDSPELAEFAERFSAYARIWSQSGFGLAFESWRRG